MSAQEFRTQIASRNATFASTHPPSIPFASFPNMKATMILSCMDPRASPAEFWSFSEAGPVLPAIIRNAGGRVTEDTLRSIRTLSAIMSYGKNTVGCVAVVHHTDCGLRNFGDGEVKELLKVRSELSGTGASEVDQMDFLSWKAAESVESSVKEDMEMIRNDPYLPKGLEVIGYAYDVFTGVATEVL